MGANFVSFNAPFSKSQQEILKAFEAAQQEDRYENGHSYSGGIANNATLKVLVGTHKTQGQRASDFCWTHDGEPLYLGFECDSDREPDDHCGCHRSFCGMNLHAATTTAEVVEFKDGLEKLVEEYMLSMHRAGWFSIGGQTTTDHRELEQWRSRFRRFVASIQHFPVGAVVEKRGEIIQTRQQKA